MDFQIYYTGDQNEAQYVINNTILSNPEHSISLERLHTRGTTFANNPDELKDILYLDLPDVIITSGIPERPVIAIELSTQKPVGHNITQRFLRLVAAAENAIPFAYIFPITAYVERTPPARSCWESVDPRVFLAMLHAQKFHKSPIIAFQWPCDDESHHNGRLLKEEDATYSAFLPPIDDEEIGKFFSFVNLVIQNFLNNKPVSELVNNRLIMDKTQDMWSRFHDHGGSSRGLYRSCQYLSTQEVFNYIKETLTDIDLNHRFAEDPLPKRFLSRENSLLFTTATKNYRSDPYSGLMGLLDYCYCRNGATVRNRDRNFIVEFSKVSFQDVIDQTSNFHQNTCPLGGTNAFASRWFSMHLRDGCKYSKPKELRTFPYFADMIIFSDEILY